MLFDLPRRFVQPVPRRFLASSRRILRQEGMQSARCLRGAQPFVLIFLDMVRLLAPRALTISDVLHERDCMIRFTNVNISLWTYYRRSRLYIFVLKCFESCIGRQAERGRCRAGHSNVPLSLRHYERRRTVFTLGGKHSFFLVKSVKSRLNKNLCFSGFHLREI